MDDPIPQELCLDVNVFIAAMVGNERNEALCREVLAFVEIQSLFYFEPAMVAYEFASNLHRKRIKGEITDEECAQKIDLFSNLPLVFQWKKPIMKMGIEAAKILGLTRTYDMAYLAVAQYRDIPLITLDNQLRKRGREIFSEIYTPVEFLNAFARS